MPASELTREGRVDILNYNSKVIWEALILFGLTLLFTNKFLSDYYKFCQVRTPKDALRIAAIRTGRVFGIYLGTCLFVYFGIRHIVYRVDQVSTSSYRTSSGPILALPSPPVTKGVYLIDIKLFSAVVTPFVFASSWVFAVFGGIGMAMLPLGLIQRFLDRPVQMDAQQEVLAKKILLNESEKAIKTAQKIREIERDLKIISKNDNTSRFVTQRRLNRKHNQAKEAWLTFEELFEAFTRDQNIIRSNPLVDWAALLLGAVFMLLSVLFVANALLSIFGVFTVFETLLARTKQRLFFYGLLSLFLICFYFALGLMAGSVKVFRLFHGFLNSFPVRKNATFTHSFFMHLNAMILGLFGMTVHVIRSIPFFLRFSEFDFLINRLIVHTRFIHFFYQFHVFEYVFVLLFLFTSAFFFMKPSPTQELREKRREREARFEVEKERLREIERGVADRGGS